MRISCPYCGERDLREFSYLGDATARRPDPAAPGAADSFYEYVYLRANPAGAHREFWYHVSGCHAWIEVVRDTRTHAMSSAKIVDRG
jgi:sarcosine oxidase subunit delta